jgi:hypothetical protein
VTKVYILHHQGIFLNSHEDAFKKEVEDVKRINPDKIICLCMEEFDFEHIFKNFFDGIQDWLLENNKKVIVSIPNPDNVELRPNIITEKNCGYYIYNYDMILKMIEQGVDYYNNIHERATKWYTCYNNTPKIHRALLLDSLVKNNLLQHGMVTFHSPVKVHECYAWQYHDGSELNDEENFILNSKPEFLPGELPKSFFNGFLDIITESSIAPNNWFCTEKTAKSIGTLKPFLVLGNQDYHKFLHDEYGIELYDEFFDYSFDSKPNLSDRIQGIVDNLNRIVKLDHSEMTTMHNKLLPKMLLNRKRFMDYGTKEYMVPRSLYFLTQNTDYELYRSDTGTISSNIFDYMEKQGWLAT